MTIPSMASIEMPQGFAFQDLRFWKHLLRDKLIFVKWGKTKESQCANYYKIKRFF